MSHSDAARLYEQFSEMPATKTFDGEVPTPTNLEILGPIVHVVYISNKWHEREGRTGKDDEYIRYIHDWKKNAPLLCFDEGTKSYHILGKVIVAPEGIKDWKGKEPHVSSHISYNIPKALTYLGHLEEIAYTNIDDEQEYKVEFGREAVLCSNSSGVKLFIARKR